MVRIAHARFLTDIGERAVAVVVEEVIGLTWKSSRTAHDAYAAERASPRLGFGRNRNVVVNVSRHEQVQIPIAVVVAEGWPGRPVPQRYASFFGDIGKCSVMIVAIEAVLSEIRDVKVGPTVVVEVAHCHAFT